MAENSTSCSDQHASERKKSRHLTTAVLSGLHWHASSIIPSSKQLVEDSGYL